jgi:hypothetical protein
MTRSPLLRPKGTLAINKARQLAYADVNRIICSMRLSIMYLTDNHADEDTIASYKLALDIMIDAQNKLEGK